MVNLLAGHEIVSIVAMITDFASTTSAYIDVFETETARFSHYNTFSGNGTFSLIDSGGASTGPASVLGRVFWIANDVESTMNYSLTINVRSTTQVPEPGTLALLGLGLAGLGLSRQRKAA